MRKLGALGAVLLAIVLWVPAGTEGQEKKDKKKSGVVVEEATPQDYEALGKTKQITGTIAAVDVKAGTMTLTVEWQHWEPKNNNSNPKGTNANVLKYQQQIMREYQQAMAAKSPIQQQQALMRLQQTMLQLERQVGISAANFQKMFHIVKSSKDFDLEVMDTLKVARATLEPKIDETTGEFIKLSDEDLKKLKSPDVSGGYTASPDDLKVGQGVKLYLSPPKKKKDDTTDKDADKTEAGSKVALPQVRMVLITSEPDPPPEPKTKNEKKKKKD
jgi:hypothetical protein